LCHIPPGNPANKHVISVGSQNAVDAHVEMHGDCLGTTCDGCAGPAPTPSPSPLPTCEPPPDHHPRPCTLWCKTKMKCDDDDYCVRIRPPGCHKRFELENIEEFSYPDGIDGVQNDGQT